MTINILSISFFMQQINILKINTTNLTRITNNLNEYNFYELRYKFTFIKKFYLFFDKNFDDGYNIITGRI